MSRTCGECFCSEAIDVQARHCRAKVPTKFRTSFRPFEDFTYHLTELRVQLAQSRAWQHSADGCSAGSRSEYDDCQRIQPLPACQSIELGTADDPAAAALDVQRCSVTPAVLPGWRADCAPLPDLWVPFLYNAAVPCWRLFDRNTHAHVVSVSVAKRLTCRRGIAAQRCTQNSIAAC